jgi:hypothetical protein
VGAHIEWVAGVLRVGSKLKVYGDPFELSCTVLRDGDTVMFLGASAAIRVSLVTERANIRAILEPLGIKHVKWIRIKNGIIKEVSVDL